MTLTISVKVPDGIVLAAESLQTIESTIIGKERFGVKCPQCSNEFAISELSIPPVRIPSGASYTANKLYEITRRNPTVGIATYGVGFLQGQTIESHVRTFEGQKVSGKESLDELSEKLLLYFQEIVKKETDVSKLPKDVEPVGFQVAGFDRDSTEGRINLIKTGKDPRIEPQHFGTFGCTWAGDGRVVSKLWKSDPSIPISKPTYGLMTLQDAIDYAIFLIRTTIDYQTFATMIPTCGGDIDLLVITYDKGLEWIQKKRHHGEYRTK
jgi:hypothetical protein